MANISAAQSLQAAAYSEKIINVVPSEIAAKPVSIHAPNARFIKLHFSQFNLPPGITVEVSNPEGSESYYYSRLRRDAFTFDSQQGDNGKTRFSAMSISGDTVIVRMAGDFSHFNPDLHRVEIDSYLEGKPGPESGDSISKTEKEMGGSGSKTESTCGENERYDAVCWADSYPDEYNRSRPVVKLVTSTGEECTAWRVGSGNHLFTAQHCISSQSDLDGSEIWFNYQTVECGGSEKKKIVKVTGNEFITSDDILDFTLFSLNDFSSISKYGNLGLDVRKGNLGEGIFIPQHGLGKAKQLALESDMNSNGFCQIDDNDHSGYASGSDIGYYCDTTTSSSGSPVIARATGKVIALHHMGGCFNSGSKISLIWPLVSDYFGGTIPQGDGNTSPSSGNQAPSAKFSIDCKELICTFDAAQSSDSDGSIIDWSWDLGDGAVASGISMEYEYSSQGSFEVLLTVKDDKGGSDTLAQTIEVTAPNTAPIAKFSASCINTDCTFDAGSSSDSDGNITAWSWSLGDGSSASGSNIVHTYSAAGTYSITLTVQDDDAASDSTTYTATVTMPNEAPVAVFSASCNNLDCSFDARASNDPDGSISAYRWSFGDGQNAIGEVVNYSYGDEGNFTVTLTVDDDRGASNSVSQAIAVEAPNLGPKAEFSVNCTELKCDFDALLSTDSDGEIIAYEWQFDDNGSAIGQKITHRFAADGSYQVMLTVEDDEGAFDSRSRTVNVSVSNAGPVADFLYECTERRCTLDAKASTDSDGRISEYAWDFGDGFTGYGQVVTHDYSKNGSYVVTLKVTDNAKGNGTRSESVEVKARPEIELSGSGLRQNQRSLATLRWSGAESKWVKIYRNNKLIEQTPNDGKYNDTKLGSNTKSARYRLCESSSNYCSDEITLIFKGYKNSRISWTSASSYK